MGEAFGGDHRRASWRSVSTICDARDGVCRPRTSSISTSSPSAALTAASAECRELATLAAGRRAAPGVRVFITTSRAVRELLERGGELEAFTRFGAPSPPTRALSSPPLSIRGLSSMMTNSAKYAHYAPGLIGTQVVYGSTDECLDSAVAGRDCEVDGCLGGWR